MKHFNQEQSSMNNRNLSNIPKDLNDLLHEFKRKKSINNINISNLPTSKPKSNMENLENYSPDKLNKNNFVKKYNDIMSEISTDYIVVQPKSNEVFDKRRHLKNLSLNNFIKSQIDKESPLKNIKRDILNAKIEDVDFDNFYMDSRNLNSIARLSVGNYLLNNLKKNELLNNLQTNLNKNHSNSNNSILSNSFNKRNEKSSNHKRAYSLYHPISLQMKRVDYLNRNEAENNYNDNSLKNTNSIKNDLSKITNILNFTNYNKSFNKKNSINSKEDFSESLRKNNSISNYYNNSLKNSSGKTFYSTLCKTPNSKLNGNNNNECIISNYSHESISPERRNLSKDNNYKISNYKTAANFFNYKKLQDSIENKGNIAEFSMVNNYNHKPNQNPFKRDSKPSQYVENLSCVEKFTDKVNLDFNNNKSDSPIKKRDSCSMDISSNNISNFNSSRNLNFAAKSEIIEINIGSVQDPEKPIFNKNTYKNIDKNVNNLDLLSYENPANDLSGKTDRNRSEQGTLFTKIDSLYPSKSSLFKSKEIKNNNIFAEKYIKIARKNAESSSYITNTSRLNLSTFSRIKNELKNVSIKNNISEKNSTKTVVFDSNFASKSKMEDVKKTLTIEHIKRERCKNNRFNNFRHLREDVDNSELTFHKNKNSLFNKTNTNCNRVSTGNNNDVELTFSKNTNSFINKSSIVNKIEATKRLKLK